MYPILLFVTAGLVVTYEKVIYMLGCDLLVVTWEGRLCTSSLCVHVFSQSEVNIDQCRLKSIHFTIFV